MSYFLWGCRGILTLITLRSERVNTMAKISRRQLCEPPTARFWKGCTPEFFGEMPSRRHPISLSSTLSIQSVHFVSLEIRVEGCPNDNGYKGYCYITQTASCLDCVCSDGYQLCSLLVSHLRQQPPQLDVPRVHHKKQSQYRKLHQQRSRGQTSTVQHFFKALKRGKGEQSETKILGLWAVGWIRTGPDMCPCVHNKVFQWIFNGVVEPTNASCPHVCGVCISQKPNVTAG